MSPIRSSKATTQAATLQASQDRALTNAKCPSSGSTSFKQYKRGDAPSGLVR